MIGNSTNNKNSFKLHLVFYLAVLGCLFFGSLQSAQAQSVTFAQFLERAGTQDFVFSNNTSNATFSTVGGGSPIFFLYSNITGLDSSLTGFQNAHLFITTTTTAFATLNLATNGLNQSLDQTTVISVVRDTPAPVGVGIGARTNLLTATVSVNTATPALTGTSTTNSGTMSISTPDHVVTFTSDFLNFSLTTQRNLALSFSSITPTLGLAGPSGSSFLQSFTAAGSGTYASDPPPTVFGPTAASATISGRVLNMSGNGLRNVQVTLTEADGSTRTVLTGNSGRYSFSNLAAGQTVVLTVRSKRYRFMSQAVTLINELNEIDFTAKF